VKNGKTFNTEEPEAAEELKVTAEIETNSRCKNKSKTEGKSSNEEKPEGKYVRKFFWRDEICQVGWILTINLTSWST
jgi:hypothetical protein